MLKAAQRFVGLDEHTIDAMIGVRGDDMVEARVRKGALAQFRELPSPGPKVGTFWKTDISKIDVSSIPLSVGEAAQAVRGSDEAARFEQIDSAPPSIALDEALRKRGVIVCDLLTAKRDHTALYAWAVGSTFDFQTLKYAALAVAFRFGGAFVYVPKGVHIEAPIVVRYRSVLGAMFPSTLVVADEAAHVTVITEIEGGAFDGALVSEVVEVVVADGASVKFASRQHLDSRARYFSNKRSRTGQDASLEWVLAELGGSLVVADVRSIIEQRGVEVSLGGVFFADGSQHVDIATEIEHRVGDTRSDTLFKSAATGHGQARYLGNIRITAHAHGSDATLRDDALLLSPNAHIDSIPALEISANDVKAFHGATVGAIGEDEIFYAMSRGIDRQLAERTIALGFFEPAVDRFPLAMRDAIRGDIAEKIG